MSLSLSLSLSLSTCVFCICPCVTFLFLLFFLLAFHFYCHLPCTSRETKRKNKESEERRERERERESDTQMSIFSVIHWFLPFFMIHTWDLTTQEQKKLLGQEHSCCTTSKYNLYDSHLTTTTFYTLSLSPCTLFVALNNFNNKHPPAKWNLVIHFACAIDNVNGVNIETSCYILLIQIEIQIVT